MIVQNISTRTIVIGAYRLDPGIKSYVPDGFYFEQKDVFDMFFQQKKLRIVEPPTIGYIGRPTDKSSFDEGVLSLSEWDTIADVFNRLNVLLDKALPKVHTELIDAESTVITIEHNFGTLDILIGAYQTDGKQVLPVIKEQTENSITLEFEEPFSGKIVLLGVIPWQS